MRTERTVMAKKLLHRLSARLKSMKSEDIGSRQWTEKVRRTLRRAAGRQVVGGDSRINLSAEQLSNMIRLREARPCKVAVSVRIDARVLIWMRSKGEGHLTRINKFPDTSDRGGGGDARKRRVGRK
jgi:uncharacterized protein (DUF4415 family)